MKRFSDNHPDITRPNLVSTGRFSPVTDDEWDYYLASVFGDVETLERVRAANPQINGTMHYEFPLIMAVRNGRTDAVRFLLEAEGYDVDEPPTVGNVWYTRCIDTAKQRGFDDIHAMLLDTLERAEAHVKSRPQHQIDAALKVPLTEGDVAAVERLLAEKPKLTVASPGDQRQYLRWAYDSEAKDKQVELIRLLIDSGVENSGTMIHLASEENNVSLVKLLLEKGVDPNTEVDSCGNCMWMARYANPNDHHEMHELLASYGGRIQLNFDDERPTPDQLFALDDERKQTLYVSGEFLWMILQSDDVELLDRFVEQFGNEKIKTMSIQKHWFHVPSITFLNRLVEHGLNVNQRDWRGRSFIFQGFPDGDNEWLQRYIELGADLNVVEFMESSTRLGYAAFYNNLEMAKFLLENGADPNLPTEHEWARSLALAEKEDHSEMVKLIGTKK